MKFTVAGSLALWTGRAAAYKLEHTRAQRKLRRARKLNVHPRQHLVDARDEASKKLKDARAMVARRRQELTHASNQVWMPGATVVRYQDAGPMGSGGRKLVWHTTEGSSLPTYQGSAPHFTIDPRTGRVWQHVAIDRAARTLKAGGPNFWGTVQVEIIGFAGASHTWPASAYGHLRELARWIERNGDVPRKCSVTFTDARNVKRLSADAFKSYSGHIGHQHAPAPNDHWDPGRLNIKEILR